MEKRSIVLLALLLAFLVAGGVFYGVGRRAGILPRRLTAQLPLSTPTPSAETTFGPVAIVSPPAAPGTPAPTVPPTATPSPSPLPSLTPTPAGGVTPTATTGGGGVLLLAGGLALVIGGGTLTRIMWQ